MKEIVLDYLNFYHKIERQSIRGTDGRFGLEQEVTHPLRLKQKEVRMDSEKDSCKLASSSGREIRMASIS